MPFTKIEKTDLHVHLNGAVPPSLIFELVNDYHIELDPSIDIQCDLIRPDPVNGLKEYLKPWRVFKKLPIGRNCLDRMIDAALRAFSDDRVCYVEVRNSPFNISELNNISLIESICWLVDSFREYGQKHAVDAKLVLSLDRDHRSEDHAQALVAAIGDIQHTDTIVGLDISGGEDGRIETGISRLFRAARDKFGLGIAIHAGEEGSTEMLYWAIRECKAQRIGHGLALSKCGKLMEEVIASEICVEVCLSTNYLSGQITEISAHPVKEFINRGVPFVLCSDNPAVNCSSLSCEYSIFKNFFGNEGLLHQMKKLAKHFCFATK
jgi:adenosine deaminase